MANKNLYEILGLKFGASKGEIKAAYRALVRIYHPDVNGTKEAEIYFKMLNNAAQTLLDDAKRLQYDTMLEISGYKNINVQNEEVLKNNSHNFGDKNFKENQPKNQEGKGFYHYKTNKKPENKDFKDYNKAKTASYSGLNIDETPKTQAQGPKMDGKDIDTVVLISKDEQKQGTMRKINVLHTDRCPKCGGVKYINGSVCALCHGVGEKSDHKILNVKIPAGIKSGAKMKIKNEGEYGKFGGKNGDLYLLIEVKEESEEKRENKTTVIEVPIAPWQAVLGDEISVKINQKNVKIKIPPLTKTKTGFRIEKAGYTVVVKVDIPEKISKREIDLYKKLREIAKKDDENV